MLNRLLTVRAFVFSTCLAANHIVAAVSLTPGDFAYGVTIDATQNQLYEFPVSEHMYSKIRFQSLSDMRIFSPDGTLVPYVIIEQDAVTTSKQQEIRDLMVFPVQQMAEQPISDLNLFVKRDKEGTIVNINTSDKQSGNKNTFYIVDLGKKLDANISALQVQWNTDLVNQTNIIVETSTDLSNWKGAGKSTILHLTHQGQTLSRNEIPISRLSRYLKVYSQTNNNWKLGKLQSVIDRRTKQEKELNWTAFKPTAEAANRFTYEVKGAFPVQSILVTPLKATTIHDVQIKSGSTANAITTPQYRGLIYRMAVGNDTLVSQPIKIAYRQHKFWQVEIFDRDNENNAAPEFKVSWHPHLVRFLSGTPGTYTVAYGNSEISHHGTSLPSNINSKNYNTLTATISKIDKLGGDSKLETSTPVSYTKPILWSILLIVLVVMGYMTFRLARHMK